jgi:hypothetical protein
MNEKSPKPKIPSLADYLIRYDLAALIEEARLDYSLSTSGGAHHLTQKDIASRFHNVSRPNKAPNE